MEKEGQGKGEGKGADPSGDRLWQTVLEEPGPRRKKRPARRGK